MYNDVVSFEQLGPGLDRFVLYFQAVMRGFLKNT